MTTYVLPDSVYRYVADREVKSGVDLMIGYRLADLPRGLGWNQIASYYAAALASAQVQVERAIALEGLWGAIWGTLPAVWKAVSPDDQAIEWQEKVSPEACWDSDRFGRGFMRGDDRSILACVSFSEGDVYASIKAWKGDLPVLNAGDAIVDRGLVFDDLLYSSPQKVADRGVVELDGLIADAARLLARASERLGFDD